MDLQTIAMLLPNEQDQLRVLVFSAISFSLLRCNGHYNDFQALSYSRTDSELYNSC
jgi:hypothetical protein